MHNVSQIWDSLGTAFAGLTPEDKTKVEAAWNMILDYADVLFKRALLQGNNWSILSARPILYSDILYFSLISSAQQPTEIQYVDELLVSANTATVGFNCDDQQLSDLSVELEGENIQYTVVDNLISETLGPITTEFSNTESQTLPDILINTGAVYVLTVNGFSDINTNPLW